MFHKLSMVAVIGMLDLFVFGSWDARMVVSFTYCLAIFVVVCVIVGLCLR